MRARMLVLLGFAVGWAVLLAISLSCRAGSRSDAVVPQAQAVRRAALHSRIIEVERRLSAARIGQASARDDRSPGQVRRGRPHGA